ncbi:MAG TPA: DUF924 family protein [Parvibaculum sp.]
MTGQAPPREVLDFWFNAGPGKWWAKDDAFDADIRRRFGAAHGDAAAGRLDHWADVPEGALALVIVLDQFSRNLFRNDHRAFMQDAKALGMARNSIARGYDMAFPPEERRWFYMPFMHAENLEAQRLCVEFFATRCHFPDHLDSAETHMGIIRRFGRFPHRNAVLGRPSTPEEQSFLDAGGFAG